MEAQEPLGRFEAKLKLPAAVTRQILHTVGAVADSEGDRADASWSRLSHVFQKPTGEFASGQFHSCFLSSSLPVFLAVNCSICTTEYELRTDPCIVEHERKLKDGRRSILAINRLENTHFTSFATRSTLCQPFFRSSRGAIPSFGFKATWNYK